MTKQDMTNNLLIAQIPLRKIGDELKYTWCLIGSAKYRNYPAFTAINLYQYVFISETTMSLFKDREAFGSYLQVALDKARDKMWEELNKIHPQGLDDVEMIKIKLPQYQNPSASPPVGRYKDNKGIILNA